MKHANILTYLATLSASVTLFASAQDSTYGLLSAVIINGTTYDVKGNNSIARHNDLTEIGVSAPKATTDDMACGPGGATLTAPKFATIAAGSSIQMDWEAEWAWMPDHHLFMMYIAPCTDQTCSDPTALLWYKVFQTRLDVNSTSIKVYPKDPTSDRDGGFQFNLEIPGSLKAARYLLRHEVLKLEDPSRPHFYISCVQIEATNTRDQVSLFPDNGVFQQFRNSSSEEYGYNTALIGHLQSFQTDSPENFFPGPDRYNFSGSDLGAAVQNTSSIASSGTASGLAGTATPVTASLTVQGTVADTASQDAADSLSEAASATDSAVAAVTSAAESPSQTSRLLKVRVPATNVAGLHQRQWGPNLL